MGESSNKFFIIKIGLYYKRMRIKRKKIDLVVTLIENH